MAKSAPIVKIDKINFANLTLFKFSESAIIKLRKRVGQVTFCNLPEVYFWITTTTPDKSPPEKSVNRNPMLSPSVDFLSKLRVI